MGGTEYGEWVESWRERGGRERGGYEPGNKAATSGGFTSPIPASSTAASTAAADHQHHDPVAAATAGAQDALAKGPQALLEYATAELARLVE